MAKNNKQAANQDGNSTKKATKKKKKVKGFAYRETRKHDFRGMANQTAQAGDRYRALQYQLC